MSTFEGIIDIYEGNAPDIDDAWNRGVRVILFETGRGLCHTDGMYAQYKQQALAKGFLWGAYHLLSGEDIDDQLDAFLTIEDGSDPRVALALDWEKCCVPKKTLSLTKFRLIIQRFNVKMRPRYPDRYPILYGGSEIRAASDLNQGNGDRLLAKCPLWYQRYRSTPLGLPKRTWPTYTLWQFDDENRNNGGPPKDVLPGADWNRFQGTIEELKAAWPFSGPAA